MFDQQLKLYRAKSGLSQRELADLLFVSQQAVAKWETGKTTPDPETVGRIAAIFGVSADSLIGTNSVPAAPRKGIKIPLFGRVAAGVPIEAIEDILDYEEITPEMAANGKHFGLTVHGDSMAPSICDKDIVVVRQQQEVENGDIAVVLVNGHDATVKKFYRTDTGVKLVPLNPNYEPMFFTPAEAADLPVSIVGKVVELRRSF